jgi:membrane protein implicated in regulation of membrane protease activity
MESRKFESLLNFVLGVSWAILFFGTAFLFAISLKSFSFSFALLSAFLFFSIFSLVIVFLESKKLQLKEFKEIQRQGELLDRISKKLDLEEIKSESEQERLGEDS